MAWHNQTKLKTDITIVNHMQNQE